MKALKPVQDFATRWDSAYYMLDRLLYLKRPLDVVLATDENAKSLMLLRQVWDVVELLQLVEIVTSKLSGRNMQQCLSPCLWFMACMSSLKSWLKIDLQLQL